MLVSLIDTWLLIKLRVGAGVFIVPINEQACRVCFFLDLVCLITAPVADGVSQALNPTLHMNDCRDPPNFTIYQAMDMMDRSALNIYNPRSLAALTMYLGLAIISIRV